MKNLDNVDRIVIVYKTSQICMDKVKKIISIMRRRGYEIEVYTVDDMVREIDKKPDIVISVGGDGTLLKISRIYQNYTPLVLPIPCGRRTVFYEEIDDEQFENVMDRLENGFFTIELLRRIKIVVMDNNNNEFLALNEVLIVSADRGKVTGFEIDIISLSLDSKLKFDGDGVMIGASPGAAAYNLSVRGPLIDYLSDNIFITPLNPMELNLAPMVVPIFSKIFVRSRGYTELYIDGEKEVEIKPYTCIQIEPSNRSFRVIRMFNRDFIKKVLDKRKVVFE